jgi:hypothetical protein
MTSYVLPTLKFIQETIATQKKVHVQHSITATQAVKAFMICMTGCFSVLVLVASFPGHSHVFNVIHTKEGGPG